MTEQQKQMIYGELLNEHRRLHNLITEIKGQSIEPSKEEVIKIKHYEIQQVKIMNDIKKLLS